MEAESDKIRNEPPTGKELARAKILIESQHVRQLERISRAYVAAFMVSQIEQPTYERRIVNLCY